MPISAWGPRVSSRRCSTPNLRGRNCTRRPISSRMVAPRWGTARASRALSSTPRGRSTSGAECATAGPRVALKPRRRRRTSSSRDSRLQHSWPKAGSWPPRRGCRSRRHARLSGRARSSFGWPTNGCASGSAVRRMCSSRAPALGPIATLSASSSWHVSRRFERSSSFSAATRRPQRPPRRSCRVSPAKSRRGFHRSCWSGAPMWSPRSGAWRPRSTGFTRPRRPVCRPSR